MTSTLLPGRWVLTDEQAAAVAAIAEGRTPADLDALRPAVTLEDGQLPTSFEAAVRLLSSATRMVLVTAARPGSGSVLTVSVLSEHPDGPFSLRGGAGDGATQLELLPTDTALLVTLDQVLDLTAFAEIEIGKEPVELSANAWTGLLAAADALREAALTADLHRSGPLTNVAVTAEAMQSQLDRGLRARDDRWVVTACALIAPPPLDLASFDADAAIGELGSAGLVEGRPVAFSPGGSRLAQTLSQMVAIGSVSLNHVAGERRVPVGQLTTIVSPTDRVIGVWRSATDGLRIRLYRSNRGLALRLLRDLITAPIDDDDPDLAAALARHDAVEGAR